MTDDEIVMKFTEEIWRGRRTLSRAISMLSCVAAILVVAPATVFFLVGRFADLLGGTDPVSYFGTAAVLVTLLIYTADYKWRDAKRPPAFASVTTKGLWIPRRATRRSPETERFVSYGSIARMTPVEPEIATRLGFQHAYAMTMVDGSVVPCSAVSLAGLANESQIRAFAIALQCVRDGLFNDAGPDRNPDPRSVEIPRRRFADALRAMSGDAG